MDTKGSAKSGGDELNASLLGQLMAAFGPPIDNRNSVQWLLNAWLLVNVVQLVGTIVLWKLDVRRKARLAALGDLTGHNRAASATRSDGYLPVLQEETEDSHDVERRGLKDELAALAGKNPWLDVIDEDPIETSPDPSSEPGHSRIYHTWSAPTAPSPFLLSPNEPTPGRTRIQIPSYTIPRRVPNPTKDRRRRSVSGSFTTVHGATIAVARGRKERRRGKVFIALSTGLVLATWTLFFATALAKINHKTG